MKKRDRKALGVYIRTLADEMHLRDWLIVLEHAPCAEDHIGYCHCIDGQFQANISVAANFKDVSREEQRETIVHELLHVHHERCWRMAQTDLAEPLGKIGYYVFCDSYRRAMEYQIDALAKVLAPTFPLIEWPKGKTHA